MSVLAAVDAFEDSGVGAGIDRARLGVIVSTAFGPHATTFGFLDGILDFGDSAVSPTAFSHSVHNAAASYIAMTLDARGPTLTLTSFHFVFHQALTLARSWLTERRCDAVLVGATDELGAVMHHVCGRLLRPAADGRIKPFAFSPQPEAVPGEGSAFFLLTREQAGKAYGRVAETACGAGSVAGGVDFQILDACGLSKNEKAYFDLLAPGITAGGYAPLFGSVPTISGFHFAVASLMLKRQRVYAAPVPENPYGVAVCREASSTSLRRVSCAQMDCTGEKALIVDAI
jgi:3-oxoacyl-[acyl-carrier-protein] synthase II